MSRFKFPNAIILDQRLPYTAKKVCAAIYASRMFTHSLSVKMLCKRVRLSVDTVYAALNLLEQMGYIVCIKNYEYNRKLQRLVWGRNSYHCTLDVKKGFTFVNYRYFKLPISAGMFVLLMLIRHTAGNTSRAFPSYSTIHKLLGMSKSWIQECLKALDALSVLHIEQCVKENGSFACNSYFLIKVASADELGDCSIIAPCEFIISREALKCNIAGYTSF